MPSAGCSRVGSAARFSPTVLDSWLPVLEARKIAVVIAIRRARVEVRDGRLVDRGLVAGAGLVALLGGGRAQIQRNVGMSSAARPCQ